MIGMTVCSGIGAPEVAAPWIDWRYQSEIKPFPSAVLAHRFPNAVNLGDMTKFQEWPDAAIDVLVGGTPCQSFSVAGLRKGLDDPRGNLMLTFLAIARRYRPRWIVWENVPGVLSSNGGRDFGAFLGGLGECGYGWAYRVLDAQYVRTPRFPRAVPQRRRRVFVVGHLGDWRRAAAVLFDGESLRGNPPPRREAGQGSARGADIGFDVCGTLSDGAHNGGGLNGQDAYTGRILPVAHALRGEGFDASEGGTGRGTPLVPVAFAHQAGGKQTTLGATGDGTCHTLGAHQTPAVAFQERGREGGRSLEHQEGVAYSLTAPSGGGRAQERCIAPPYAVRRLTPVECERLQGFPDGWTQIPYRNKPADACLDGPRYKALGNSWAVNCGEFIFDRMRIVDAMPEASLEAAE